VFSGLQVAKCTCKHVFPEPDGRLPLVIRDPAGGTDIFVENRKKIKE
jgi:hypothetical protein